MIPMRTNLQAAAIAMWDELTDVVRRHAKQTADAKQ